MARAHQFFAGAEGPVMQGRWPIIRGRREFGTPSSAEPGLSVPRFRNRNLEGQGIVEAKNPHRRHATCRIVLNFSAGGAHPDEFLNRATIGIPSRQNVLRRDKN